jgi:hypothetical protein
VGVILMNQRLIRVRDDAISVGTPASTIEDLTSSSL